MNDLNRQNQSLKRVERSWRRLRPFLGASPLSVGVLVSASVLAGLAEAGILAVVATVATAMADRSAVATDLGPVEINATIPQLFIVALLLILLRVGFLAVNAYMPSRLAASAQANLRGALFDGFIDADWDVQSREREGRLEQLVTTHVNNATAALQNFANATSAGFNFLALLGSALVISAPVALGLIVVAGLLFFGLRPLARLSRRYSKVHADAVVDYAAAVSETVRMAEELEVYGVGDVQSRRAGRLVDEVRKAFFRVALLSRAVPDTYQSVVLFLLVSGLAGLYLLGGGELAALGAVVLMLIRSLSYSQQFQSAYQRINELAPYIDAVSDAVDHYRTHAVDDHGPELPSFRKLRFDEVSFQYIPGTDVLREVTFEVTPGEVVGIIGPSGAGKSTLVQLLLRVRTPTSGQIFVNGRDARDFSVRSWRRLVAYVPQDARLLTGTVLENIRFLRDHIQDKAVKRAAKLAHIHDEIERWPGGYQRLISQRADAVSGGQRQRICLARALVDEPDILILDEPTSALDLDSEALVQRSLAELKGRVTVFIVAHRLSTLSLCDRIMVFVDGRLEAFEHPNMLQESSEFYRRALELSLVR